METTSYKIRRKSDGLFSRGGCVPQFHKIGKTYSTKGHVKMAIANHYDSRYWTKSKNLYEDCEIVEMHIVVDATQDVKDFYPNK